MTKSNITRERAQQIFLGNGPEPSASEERELARIALAAMDSEPVAWRWNYGGTTIWRLLDTKPGPGSNPRCPRVIEPLYRHAQLEASHLSRICAESYQVVGALAEALRIFNDVGVIKALDNLSAQEIIHDDVLPFLVPEAAQPEQEVIPECFRNAVSALESLYRNGQKQCWNERYTTDMAYASGVINACRNAQRKMNHD